MFDARRIVSRIRDAGAGRIAEVVPTLAEFSADALADVAASKQAWWVKRAAIRALAGRVDDRIAALLLERVLDPKETSEIRKDAVEVLAGRTEIVPALRRLRHELSAAGEQQALWIVESLVAASAQLGDVDAALGALRLRYDEWSHRRAAGEAAVKRLESRAGVDGVARALGGDGTPVGLARLAREHPDENARRWAIDVASPDAPFVLDAIRDSHWKVTEGANAALTLASAATETLLVRVAEYREEPPIVRAQALSILLARGRRPLVERVWKGASELRLELPGVPRAIRNAILLHYLPGQRGTDPRLLLEGELDLAIDRKTERVAGANERPEHIVDAARAALASVGVESGPCTPIGEVNAQGEGNYGVLEVGGAALSISDLGRFVSEDDSLASRHGEGRAALQRAGFVFIEGALAQTVFEGLRVYFFGSRDPLTIRDLLFYWQD